MTSPATHSPASTSLPAHTLLLGILSVTPNKDMNDSCNEISNPVIFVTNNSSTSVLTNQSDDSSVTKSLLPVHNAQKSKLRSTHSNLEHTQPPNTKLEITTPSSTTKKSNQTVSFNGVDEL